jgi:fructose-1,6-bisphosphatase/inositol monophosphatase family enzyme
MDDLLPTLLDVAVRAAQAPSPLIMSGFRSPGLETERKGDGSPVTHFDREAERTIRAFIAQHQPGDWPVLGEEFGDGSGDSRYRWVVDPIDGTFAFTRGLPTFGTLLAFEDVAAHRSLVGVIQLPATGETYSAARGLGAWCNGQPIRVAPDRAMADCLISVPAAEVARLRESYITAGSPLPHLRCFTDCAAHAMVARGSIDVLAEFGLCRWDIAATEVVVEEAGGLVLIRDSIEHRGKYDAIVGASAAVRDVAARLDFRTKA